MKTTFPSALLMDDKYAFSSVETDLLPQLLKHIPYAFAALDKQMRYVAHSQSWLKAYHLPEQSLIGLSHYEVFPEIGKEWKQIHQQCLSGATLSREDEPFPRQDGSVDYVSWTVMPWRQADGEIIGIFMFTTVSTAQVVAENRSRRYQQQLQSLLQTTKAVPWRMDVESGLFSYMGPQVEKLLGYPANTWENLQTWAERIHPQDRDWALSRCQEWTAEGRDHDFEYRALHANGETLWLRDAVTVIKDEQGRAVELAGLFIDISEQKRGEEQLRRSEEQYRSVIKTSGDGFWHTDMEGYLLETNEAYARLSGYRVDELVGMHISDLEAYEKPKETASHIEKIIRDGADIFETQHRRKDGTVWDVEISTSFSHDYGGHFFVFCRDISERKRTQQEMRLIAEVFKNTSEGIVITKPDGTIIDVNPAYCEITGYSREEMIGAKPSKIKSDRHDKEFYHHMWQSLVEKGYWVGEIWDRRKNGEVFPKWLNINAVRDEHGGLTHYVGTFSDISVLKGIEKELEYMAYYDPLTGLPNRLLFKDRLESELKSCQRFDNHCAVLFLDLDRFKLINDTLGHTAGDELLIEVARRIEQSVRSNDTVARLGGDEFTLLLSQLKNPDAAAGVAQNLIEQLAQPITLQDNPLRVGASIGIAIYPEDGDNFTTLTRHADAAMYEAKAQGRGQYRFFSDYMDQSAHEHLSLERDLHLALERGQFFLVFQPQVNARTGCIIQCEALIRWQHPERGLVSPDKFIPIAEDTGLIHHLGDWVVAEVCRQLNRWKKQGIEPPPVAVNLSARQFRQDGLVERIMELLSKYQVGVEELEFEITESVAMENAEATMQRLTALSETGFSLAIDDFGTGYSSLSYLKRFPVRKLKLDRSFVRDIMVDENDAAISAAVIHMADSLGMEVVAEGVESVEQRDFLVNQGCAIIQGYLYSRPLSSDDYRAYLAERQQGGAG
jgi:diguanylate cyclase (GGDEF)-like protein/PAS domain S-box-containing protein